MGNLIDLFHSKLELFRLEQRYTRRRNRRSTFVSEAQYVDGEYVYAPNSTYSAQVTGGSSSSESSNNSSSTPEEPQPNKQRMSRRLSKMAKGAMDWRQGASDPGSEKDRSRGRGVDRRPSRLSVREIQWDGGVRS